MLNVRKATASDFERIMQIYRYAQDYMIKTGNPGQWGRFYPSDELIKKDIEDEICYVICHDLEIHGVFVLFKSEEPTYRYIERGDWLNDDPYVTIHRIAGDGQIHGLFACTVEYCRTFAENIRIDTHANNTVMQRQIEKNGFIKCGIIYVNDGTPRIAYQWAKHDTCLK